jgi:hypothetical protein
MTSIETFSPLFLHGADVFEPLAARQEWVQGPWRRPPACGNDDALRPFPPSGMQRPVTNRTA